jgi:cell division protein FtsL
MMRINLVLAAAVMASALVLVRTQYESRALFAEIEKSASEARRLETERERLMVDQRAQSAPQRLMDLAKGQLAMRPTTPAITQYVASRDPSLQPAAPKASAAASGARP